MRSKLYPWKKKIIIKMTQLVFVCVFYGLFASRAIQRPFYRVLDFELYLKILTNFHTEPGDPVGQCASAESSL